MVLAARNILARMPLSRLACYGVVLSALYLYALFVVRPELLFHARAPAFLATWPRFIETAAWPAGPAEFLSAALEQTLAWPFSGALVITAAFGLVCLLTELLLIRAAGARPSWLPFLPAAFLLVFLNRYTLPLGAIVSLCLALWLACRYARLPARLSPIRVLSVLAVCSLFYVAAGATALLLACLCGLIEILGRRRPLVGLAMLLPAPAIPWLGSRLYEISTREAFVRLTALQYDFYPPWAFAALYASFPLTLLLTAVWPAFLRRRAARRGKPAQSRAARRQAAEPLNSTRAARLLGWSWRTALPIALGACVAYGSFDPVRRTVLALDYHTRAGEWEKVLQAARPLQWSGDLPTKGMEERLSRTCFLFGFPAQVQTAAPVVPTYSVAIHNINLALAHRGRLLDDLFSYPQPMGVSVVRLLPDDMGAYVAHSYNPDILLELGDVNGAERVACESLANVGPRPWLLQRLITVNILKSRPQAARTCLTVMAADPLRRHRAAAMQRELDTDPSLSARTQFQRIRARMFRKDHTGRIAGMHPDEELLRHLLTANPHNRMAFDYLMAHYLLTLRDDQLVAGMQHLREFGYTRIPRHCQECILMRAKLTGSSPDLRGFSIAPEIARRFEAFRQDFDALGGPGPNKVKVRDALLPRYADTYWFYALFGDTVLHSVPPAAASRPGEGS